MPKKLSDKDRLLAFAFRASTEELVDAIALLKAAHSAKAGGKGTPRPVVRKATPPKLARAQSSDGQSSE